jgi:pimeloyl-ACP methyl ester carboxylesterase
MRILEKDGLKYVDEGQGEIVLFFHGWGVSPYSCQNLIKALSVKYRVIAPFFRSFARFKEDEKVIENLVVDHDKVIVVGHSAGGISAVSFSSHFQAKTRALILMDSLGAVTDKAMSNWTRRWFKESLDILIHPDSLSKILIKDFFYQMHAPSRLLQDSKYIINQDIELTLNFPVLILWGREDELIPIENGYNLQKSIRGAKLKVVEGNHYWFLKKPELFMQELRECLKS